MDDTQKYIDAIRAGYDYLTDKEYIEWVERNRHMLPMKTDEYGITTVNDDEVEKAFIEYLQGFLIPTSEVYKMYQRCPTTVVASDYFTS